MIYPSGRAVWAAAAGAVPAFLVALALPSLWYLGLLWICVLLAFLAVDAAGGTRAGIADRQPAGAAAGRRRRRSSPSMSPPALPAGRRPRSRRASAMTTRLAPLGGTGGALVPGRRRRIARPAIPGAAARHRQLRPAVAALARAVRPGLEAGRRCRLDSKVAVLPDVAQRARRGDHCSCSATRCPTARRSAAPARAASSRR